MSFLYSLLLLIMPLTHIEHPEDMILTGDLSSLECMGSEGNLSAKIDGSPAVVWGNDPKDGRFFVGTKSVFNKRNPKLMKSYEDMTQTMKVRCMKYLQRVSVGCLPEIRQYIRGILSVSVALTHGHPTP